MASIVKIAICDDELRTVRQIEKLLMKYENDNHLLFDIKPYYDGESLWQTMAGGERFDLLLLDIKMPDLNGVTLSKKIREELKDCSMIIYVSGKGNRAREVFNYSPCKFIDKPFSQEEFIQLLSDVLAELQLINDCFEVAARSEAHRIPYKEIIYFASNNKKIDIIAVFGVKTFTGKISDYLSQWLPKGFLQIHQSYVINVRHLRSRKADSVTLSNGDELPISQKYRKAVERYFIAQNSKVW